MARRAASISTTTVIDEAMRSSRQRKRIERAKPLEDVA
jgi:hypothetical protein